MNVTKFTQDMNIIAKLDNEPNDMGGLTAAQLKAKFDEGGLRVQEYINGTLIPEIESIPRRSVGATDDGAGNVTILGYAAETEGT